MAPGAIARRAHDLPIRPVGGQRDRAAETSPLVGADRLRRSRRRCDLAPEQDFCRVRRQLREHRCPVGRLLGCGVLPRGVATAAEPGGENKDPERGEFHLGFSEFAPPPPPPRPPPPPPPRRGGG